MRSIALSLLSSLFICSFSLGSEPLLEAAKKITGKYHGAWAIYGVQDGKVVERASWTDVLVASDPVLLKDRAQVLAVDEMTFPDGTVRKSEFVEGYLANADGSVGDRFYEIQGSVVRFKKLTENDWAFHTTPSEWELPLMGFDPKTVVSASHVTVKATTHEGNVDTDHITRTTTVQWKTAAGAFKTIQFVSMKGFHTRTAE